MGVVPSLWTNAMMSDLGARCRPKVKRAQGSLTRAVLCVDCYGLEFRFDAKRPHVNSDPNLICTATHLSMNTVNHDWLDQPLPISPHGALPSNEPLDVQPDCPLLQRLRPLARATTSGGIGSYVHQALAAALARSLRGSVGEGGEILRNVAVAMLASSREDADATSFPRVCKGAEGEEQGREPGQAVVRCHSGRLSRARYAQEQPARRRSSLRALEGNRARYAGSAASDE